MPLVGGRTLFDDTLARLRRLAAPGRLRVVSARSIGRVTRAALKAHPGVRLMLEPEARDTAAAIAWAAASVVAEDPEGIVGVFPADHLIRTPAAFARTVRTAARIAAARAELVLIGVEPDRPETAYGYLRLGESIDGPARKVTRFLEKPGPARARRLLREGGCLWNAGMIVARASTLLDETRLHAPEVWAGLGPVLERIASGFPASGAALARAYRRIDKISFDYAVLERSRNVLAIPAGFGWSDLGSWNSLAEHLPLRRGNRVGGEPPVASVDASGNVVWNPGGKAIALLGVENLIVVETADALLICAVDRAQDVRRVVEQLGRVRRQDLT